MNSEKYDILIDQSLEKIIKKNLPANLSKVLTRKIKYLAENPNHPSLNTKQLNISQQKLKVLGADEVWEFRINMSFRCVCYLMHKDKKLIIAFAGNHDEIKKKYH